MQREVVVDEIRLLRLASKQRLLRFYYTGMVSDAIDRGLLAATLTASTETVEAMAEKGWLEPLPFASKINPRPWVVTEAGFVELDRLTGGGS